MYHDQALIPLKALDFDNGVNVTLGLPFVRTSPDHGTALDIAGTGRADESSLMASLELAAALARRRARIGPRVTTVRPPLPPLRDVIARHNLATRRSLGQHFLLDLNLTGRIARIAGDLTGVSVIEIGPGPGGLTRSLLEAGAPLVVAVEKDPRCIAAIGELADAFPGRLRVVEADALEVDVRTLAQAPRKIVANLPFNVGTPLLLRWLRDQGFPALTLMFQKEVADRLVAPRGDPALRPALGGHAMAVRGAARFRCRLPCLRPAATGRLDVVS